MTEKQYMKNLTVPRGRVDVVLDTDTYNEIDDQFALAYLLLSEEKLNTVGICAAPFHNARSLSYGDGMEKSYNEIIKLLSLAGRQELKSITFRGSEERLPDEKTPVISDAAKFMAEKANGYSPENPLYIVAIGAVTNVASAILLNPKMIENTVVVWLGGQAHHMGAANEFNLSGDIAASRVLMGCGVPLVQLPCSGVVSELRTNEWELRHFLCGKNELADYLAENTIEFSNPSGENRPWSKVIWDVSAVAWLLNDESRFMDSRIENAVLPGYDGKYETQEQNHKFTYVFRINRDRIFEDVFTKLTK